MVQLLFRKPFHHQISLFYIDAAMRPQVYTYVANPIKYLYNPLVKTLKIKFYLFPSRLLMMYVVKLKWTFC